MDMAEKSEIDLFKTQICCLEENIKRSQLRCEELKKENKKLSCWNKTLQEDRKDISEYLLHCISAKEEEEPELLRQLEQDELDRHKEDEAMKLQLSKKRQEIQEQAEQIHSDTEKLAQQKDEILQMKEHMKEQLELMEEKLKTEAEKHKATMESLQLELDSKMIKKYQEAHDIMNREVEAREQEKRSQTRQEAKEIQSMNEQMSRIAVQRESLNDRKYELQKQIAKKRTFLAELTGDVFQLNTESKQLAMKCDSLEAKLADGRMHLQKALNTEETLRQQLASLSEQLHHETCESQQLDVKLQREKDMIKELKKTMWKTAAVLRATVKDFQNPEEAQRQLQKLLQFLEGSHPRGPVPTLDDSASESSQGQKPKTSSPSVSLK